MVWGVGISGSVLHFWAFKTRLPGLGALAACRRTPSLKSHGFRAAASTHGFRVEGFRV